MDSSITKVLQAVQEEFPPRRKARQTSNSSAGGHPRHPIFPINDDDSFPTSAELHLYSGPSPDTNSGMPITPPSAPAFPEEGPFSDGQQTPRAERTASLGAESSSSTWPTDRDTVTIPHRENVLSASQMPGEDYRLSQLYCD